MFRRSLYSRFEQAFSQETVVSVVDRRTVTGIELLHAIDRVGDRLHALGAGPQERVLAALPNGLALLVLYLACLRHRIIICPVNPDSPAQEVDYIRSVFRPDVIVEPEQLEEWVTSALASAPQDASGLPDHDIAYEPDDIFSVNFTSGTTGKPKGVAHFAERMLANGAAFNTLMGCDESQRMIHVMPMYYMAGLLNTILCPLLAGGSIIVAPALLPRTALSFWRQFVDNKGTAFWLSPTMLRMVMKLDRTGDSKDYAGSELRHPFVGTAPMPVHLGQEFRDTYGVKPLQSYGLSELLLVSCDNPSNPDLGSVGTFLEGVEGSFGGDQELEIKTPFLFAGYLGAETGQIQDQTRSAPFKTGDLAAWNPESGLKITGRKKDLIVVGGINISPAAIEETLHSVSGVSEIAVVREEDEVYGEVPVAFVLLEKGLDRTKALEALRACAQTELTAAARPVRYYPVEAMPMGPTGKIQKHLLTRGVSS